jgi:hypothetical protein
MRPPYAIFSAYHHGYQPNTRRLYVP